jgi:DNA-binding response OmpR family regulator
MMNIGLGEERRTILLVDTDAHARAGLRLALEAAGFSVGEAANEAEAERTALRIKPDAILAELIPEAGADDRMLSERLHARGSKIPCYIVSAAADALLSTVGLHQIGVAGVFLKPVDTAIVIQTLKSRLGHGQGERARA